MKSTGLKKNLDCSIEAKRQMIDRTHDLSIARQCELLGLPRSSFYYEPCMESPFNLTLMNELDRIHIKRPFLGRKRLTDALRDLGYSVSENRVHRLMKIMDITAVYPRPKTSKARQDHKVHPYLLRGLKIDHPNFVWCTDITYIGLERGFMYLVAVMDWYSRYILSWRLSNTLDVDFCLDALEQALGTQCPEIFNSDQGAQFTSNAFTSRLEDANIRISMDGRGRVFDNIFIERFWRSLKYEEIYLNSYTDVQNLLDALACYIDYYNNKRRHQGLDRKTPAEVHFA